jgi:ATP-dependent DNA helicase RecG
MPKGRRAIKTILVAESNRKSLYEFVKEELDQSNQVFFVYPLIEESEALELKNAMSMYEELNKVFEEYKVGLLHGRLSPSEKNDVMDKFVQREYDILVSTSVVEVGIDIPDATVMVIEHPDRFGLSQLHQLRGRVGRSDKQSYCFLVIDDDANNEIKSKMNSFSKTLDGFEVAEIDLKWRGPGKFFGVEQHGVPEFKFLDLVEDMNIIESSRKMVELFLSSIQSFDRYPNLKHELQARYGDSIHLVNVL